MPDRTLDVETMQQVRFLADCAASCSCCWRCWESPCGGTQQGTHCDAMPCKCDDIYFATPEAGDE